ncbi:sce7726 family protein [Azospirillum sp.]|uniref:sce7726 family protein n=1 Tax=Azospirillum sp. TaxID=34012 RepID=UPI003D704225
MRDADVRRVLRAEIDAAHAADHDTRVVEELALEHGTSRVDIAVINGEIHGYEIKSERDTLERLPKQIELYSLVLDKVTLVVGARHLSHAQEIIPPWWGIRVAELRGGSVVLSPERSEEVNPSPDALTIAMLLWREEALEELEARGLARGVRSKPRRAVYERLVSGMSLPDLRHLVRCRLKNRANWRVAEPLVSCGD